MKYSLNCHQPYNYLSQADEIKFLYKDRKLIDERVIDYPEALMVIQCATDDKIDWEEIHQLDIVCEHKFCIGLHYLNDVFIAKEKNIKFYLQYPIHSFYELHAIIQLNPEFIILDAPLFFSLDKVKKITDIKIRAIPNIATTNTTLYKDGVIGTWIRPEDISFYDGYFDTIEFQQVSLQQEQGLYRIYAKTSQWSGPVNDIIQGLNYSGINRLILSEFATIRANCGQRCQEGGSCHQCYRMLDLSDEKLLLKYKQDNKKKETF